MTNPSAVVDVESVLVEIDGPQLVLSRDVVGARYLCIATRADQEGDHYLGVQISDERLRQLRAGALEVRSVFDEPEMGMLFEGVLRRTKKRSAIHLTAQAEISPRSLPGKGLFLTDFDDQPEDETAVRDAFTKNAAVVICRMNPPESRGILPKVDADRLAGYIATFQFFVRQCARKAAARVSTVNEGNDPFGLNVYGFSGGSFQVHFEAKGNADLLGRTLIGEAMRRVDEIMRLADQSVRDLEPVLEKYRGAELAAYRQLLRFVDEHDVPFSYRWAEPALSRSAGEGITSVEAKRIAAVLDASRTLTSEPFSFVGRFTAVNTDRTQQSWVARDEKLRQERGFVHEGNPAVLEGVTIKTTLYTFEGDVRLVSAPTNAKPKLEKYLRSVRPT